MEDIRLIAIRADCGDGYSLAWVWRGSQQMEAQVDLNTADGTPEPRVIFADGTAANVGDAFARSYASGRLLGSLSGNSKEKACQKLREASVKLSPKVSVVLDTQAGVNFRGSRETALRGFDHRANTFNINMLEGIGEFPVLHAGCVRLTGVADIGIGANALLTQSAGLLAGSGVPIDLLQAYAELKVGGFFLSGGKRVTTAGMEVIRSDQNANISRSWMFHNAIPYTDTGLRIGYAGPVAGVMLGVNNGWDRVVDNNDMPAFLLNLSLTPTETLTFSATFLASPEKDDDRKQWRLAGDFVALWKVAEPVSLGFNYDHGAEKNGGHWDQWKGAAGYLTVQPSAWPVAFVVRGEYFQDDGSRLGLGALELVGVTTGVNFHLTRGLDLKTEFRQDYSLSGPVFDGHDNQQTFATQLVYSYGTQ